MRVRAAWVVGLAVALVAWGGAAAGAAGEQAKPGTLDHLLSTGDNHLGDGFGYLSRHDPDAPGHCVTATVPAAAAGRQVWVNVEGVDAAHPLTVELLDDHDRPLVGYSGRDAAKVATAGTRVARRLARRRGWRGPAPTGVRRATVGPRVRRRAAVRGLRRPLRGQT